MKLTIIQIICGALITLICIYVQICVIGLSLFDTEPLVVVHNAYVTASSAILPAEYVIAYFLNILLIILGLVVTISGIFQLKRYRGTL